MCKRRDVVIVWMVLGALASLGAEPRVGVELSFINPIVRGDGWDEWLYAQTGSAEISLLATESNRVRGGVELELQRPIVNERDSEQLSVVLQRLYLRPSVGDLLFSVGKTRTTWGTGIAFNAGDIVFGSLSPSFDVTSSEPRGETEWLTNVEIPIGFFSFVEVLVVAPHGGDEHVRNSSLGTRVSLELGPLTTQLGYLYRGGPVAGIEGEGHRVFVSIDGYKPLNWSVAASCSTPLEEISTSVVRDTTQVSFALSYDHTVFYDQSVTWRVEGVIAPWGEFSARDEAVTYGVYLYPTLTYTPRSQLSFSVSSIVSPVDISALCSTGVRWNLYEELILESYLVAQIGENGDTFGYDRTGGMALQLGTHYTY